MQSKYYKMYLGDKNMKKEGIKFFDLPFYDDLFKLYEAFQYSIPGCPIADEKDDYTLQRRIGWLRGIKDCISDKKCAEMKQYKIDHAEELKSNPLMLGIIDLYLKASTVSSEQDYRKLFEKYQDIQVENPFEKNMQLYVDMGCVLSTMSMRDDGKIRLAYPLFLFKEYSLHGGSDDDYRGGYLFPHQLLNASQVEKLHETNLQLFKSESVKTAYEKMVPNM